MSKSPKLPPFQAPAPAVTPADDEADHIVIVAKAVRPKGAIAQVREHLVQHPEASIAELKTMLAAAGLDKINEATIKTVRQQTLAVLKFIDAKTSGAKTTSLEGVGDAIKYYVVRHPTASVEAISEWLKSKNCETTPHALKSARAATLAVLAATRP